MLPWGTYRKAVLYSTQKGRGLECHAKGQFSKARHISKEVCRIFVFVGTNAVLVRKIDKA